MPTEVVEKRTVWLVPVWLVVLVGFLFVYAVLFLVWRTIRKRQAKSKAAAARRRSHKERELEAEERRRRREERAARMAEESREAEDRPEVPSE